MNIDRDIATEMLDLISTDKVCIDFYIIDTYDDEIFKIFNSKRGCRIDEFDSFINDCLKSCEAQGFTPPNIIPSYTINITDALLIIKSNDYNTLKITIPFNTSELVICNFIVIRHKCDINKILFTSLLTTDIIDINSTVNNTKTNELHLIFKTNIF